MYERINVFIFVFCFFVSFFSLICLFILFILVSVIILVTFFRFDVRFSSDTVDLTVLAWLDLLTLCGAFSPDALPDDFQ